MSQSTLADAAASSATRTSPHRSIGAIIQSPPRAPLAFRVGVVGHRPNRLGSADLGQLASVLNTILGIVRHEVAETKQRNPELFDDSPPVVRALSPLAEGTDRIFAEQALAAGYELCCVMPFPQAEFERDFESGAALENDSLIRFRGLVSRASARFELDGNRQQPGAAYGVAGRTVLNQSDLLVVVWDGQRQEKRGGTEETLDNSRRLGVPVVWVDAHAPHHWQVVEASPKVLSSAAVQRLSPYRSDDEESLRKMVRAATDLPRSTPPLHSTTHKAAKSRGSDDSAVGLKQFYSARQPTWTMAVLWKAFRDVFGDGRIPRVSLVVEPFEEAVKQEWPDDVNSALGRLVNRMRPFYAWPDGLAVLNADRYRSAFILAYLLAALAVGMALLPIGFGIKDHRVETVFILLELSAIIVILGVVLQGRRSRWHERWIDYRLTAELVRQLRLVAPLGGGPRFPQIPAHCATYGQPGSSWMAWYVRALERALCMPTAVVDKGYLEAFLAHLGDLVKGQSEFHLRNADRCRRIEHWLHGISIMLLLLTLAACGLHLLPRSDHDSKIPLLLTFVCGFFPALGAALAGIINQGEFRRIEKRSESMIEHMDRLKGEIDVLCQHTREVGRPPTSEQFSQQALALAGDVARLWLNEVLDWRIVFLERPLQPPG